MHGAYAKGDLVNILLTIPIKFSNKPGVIENVFIGVDCSPEENKTYIALLKEYSDIFT